MTVKYVSHGIILDDIVFPDGRTQMGVIGGGGPQAAWGMAAAIGSGKPVGIIAALNVNEPDSTLDLLKAAGIDLEGVYRNDLPTPRAWQILEHDGLRRHLWRVPVETLGMQLRRGKNVAPPGYSSAAWYHWGIHTDDVERDLMWTQALGKLGVRVCLEVFMPPEEPLPRSDLLVLLSSCDMFSINLHEAEKMTGISDKAAMLEHFRSAGASYLILHMGADGADCWNLAERTGVHVPAYPTNAVDVVGAGNTFTGAFMAALDTYRDISVAAVRASVAASYMIEQVGIPHGLPTESDFEQRLSTVFADIEVVSI